MLGQRGPEGLTVQALCEAAQRTRGSLYHHFADHDALLRGILEHWAQRNTQDVIAEVAPSGDIGLLSQLALGLDLDVEVGVRQLVARRPDLKPLVAQVDAMRVAFLVELYTPDFGEQAGTIAQVEYAAFLGFLQLEPRPSLSEMTALYRDFERLIRR